MRGTKNLLHQGQEPSFFEKRNISKKQNGNKVHLRLLILSGLSLNLQTGNGYKVFTKCLQRQFLKLFFPTLRHCRVSSSFGMWKKDSSPPIHKIPEAEPLSLYCLCQLQLCPLAPQASTATGHFWGRNKRGCPPASWLLASLTFKLAHAGLQLLF